MDDMIEFGPSDKGLVNSIVYEDLNNGLKVLNISLFSKFVENIGNTNYKNKFGKLLTLHGVSELIEIELPINLSDYMEFIHYGNKEITVLFVPLNMLESKE